MICMWMISLGGRFLLDLVWQSDEDNVSWESCLVALCGWMLDNPPLIIFPLGQQCQSGIWDFGQPASLQPKSKASLFWVCNQHTTFILSISTMLVFGPLLKKTLLSRLKNGFYLNFIGEVMEGDMKTRHFFSRLKFHQRKNYIGLGFDPQQLHFLDFQNCVTFYLDFK